MQKTALAIGFTGLAALTLAHGSDTDRKTFEKLQGAYLNAMKHKDISWFEKTATPDFTVVEPSGKKVGRAAALGQMKQMFSSTKVDEVTSTLLSFKVNGKTAVLKTKATFRGAMVIPGQKPAKISDASTDEETWVKTSSGWKVKTIKMLSEKTLINGKPMPNM